MDEFADTTVGLTSPAVAAEQVTPDDVQPLNYVTRAIYVGQSGDLRVILKSGAVADLKNLQAGVIYPLRISQVLLTGTSAGDIVGLR